VDHGREICFCRFFERFNKCLRPLFIRRAGNKEIMQLIDNFRFKEFGKPVVQLAQINVVNRRMGIVDRAAL